MKKLLVLFLMVFNLFALEIKDSYNDLKIDGSVNRIVVFDYVALDVLIELGAYDKVVGITSDWKSYLGTDFERFGYDFNKLPNLGSSKSANYEEVMSLKPDVVLISKKYTEVIEKFKQLGVNVLVTSFRSDKNGSFKNDLFEGINSLAILTSTQKKADELFEFMKKCREILDNSLQNSQDNKSRVMILDKWLGSYGAKTYVNEFFTEAGADFFTAKLFDGYKELNPETILSYNPDYIFIQSRYADTKEILEKNDVLNKMSAIKDHRMIVLPDYAKAWGHVTPEAYSIGEIFIRKTLNKDSLKEVDLDTLVNEFYDKFYYHK